MDMLLYLLGFLRTFGAAVTGKILEVDTAQFFGEAVQGNFVILPWHIAVIVITLLTLFAGASSIEKTNKIHDVLLSSYYFSY